MISRSADTSLRLLDKLLRERPSRTGHDFSQATRWIAAYRDELIAIWRRTAIEADRQRLAKVNAVLSVVVGGQYPLGTIPWGAIERARDQLALVTAETD